MELLRRETAKKPQPSRRASSAATRSASKDRPFLQLCIGRRSEPALPNAYIRSSNLDGRPSVSFEHLEGFFFALIDAVRVPEIFCNIGDSENPVPSNLTHSFNPARDVSIVDMP